MADRFKKLGKVIGHESGDDAIAKLRQTLSIESNIFRDFESGAIEAIFNRGTVYFKTSAEMAAVFLIVGELGGEVTAFDGSGWSIDIGTMVSARSPKDYQYLMSLVRKVIDF